MDDRKILLDTDIGDDIDDAFALVSALKSPEVEIVGITTVFNNAAERARIARKILVCAGQSEIPVFAGYGDTMTQTRDKNERTCQYTPDIESREYDYANVGNEGKPAVDFIIDSVRKYGNELDVVAIGPLTNIAKAFSEAPQIMKKARITAMGGDFYSQFREWNILCDPEAAKIVLESEADVSMIGLDVTMQTTLRECDYNVFMSGECDKTIAYLRELVKMWHDKNRKMPCLHDPLALFAVIDPELVLMENNLVEVETSGKWGRGMTVNIDYQYGYLDERLDGRRIKTAKAVNRIKFMQMFFDNLKNK